MSLFTAELQKRQTSDYVELCEEMNGKVRSGSSSQPHVPRNKTQTQTVSIDTLAVPLGSFLTKSQLKTTHLF